MPNQIQKFIQTHQEHIRAQTQKNHTNLEIKHRKIHKRILYLKKKKNQSIFTQTKLSKRENNSNMKIKSIQSLTKYPQNRTNSAQSLNHTNTKQNILASL